MRACACCLRQPLGSISLRVRVGETRWALPQIVGNCIQNATQSIAICTRPDRLVLDDLVEQLLDLLPVGGVGLVLGISHHGLEILL